MRSSGGTQGEQQKEEWKKAERRLTSDTQKPQMQPKAQSACDIDRERDSEERKDTLKTIQLKTIQLKTIQGFFSVTI